MRLPDAPHRRPAALSAALRLRAYAPADGARPLADQCVTRCSAAMGGANCGVSTMAVKFAASMNAINRGLDSVKADRGAHMVEDWEAALADSDIPGTKGILRDLTSLRKQLEKDTPDTDRVHALLHRLGQATVKISEKADKSQDKIKALGEALSEAGVESHDEEEDHAAAANPKRAPKTKS